MVKKKPDPKNTQETSGKPLGYVFGRPTSYEPRFCEMLIKHMEQGYSFESFGGVVYCGKTTLYRWSEEHEDFRNAKQMGQELARLHWEKVGSAMTTGNLRRVKSEKTTTDKNGRQTVVKQYEPTRGDSKVWAISMRNRFNYQNKIQIEGHMTNYNKNADDMTLEDIDKELEQLRKRNKEDADVPNKTDL